MRPAAGRRRAIAFATVAAFVAAAGTLAATAAPETAAADPAAAGDASGAPAAAKAAGTSSLALGIGAVGIFDADPRGLVSFEYRYAVGRLRPSPWLSAEATGNDRFFGFGGSVDIPLGRRVMLTPGLGAAIYLEHGGLGLGWHLEFRSLLEVTWPAGATRIGAAFEHFSNANLGGDNPGTETLRLVWIVPIGRP